MKRFLTAFVGMSLIVACSSTSTGSSGGSTSGSSTSSSSSGGSSSGGTKLPASTTEATVQVNGSCPAFAPCGGNPSGTYDYKGGCVDAFSQLRSNCQGLDTSGVNVKVKGSIYFLAAGALERNVTVTVSGTLTGPSSCVAGQCIAFGQALQQAGFNGASCTAAGANCACTINRTETDTSATTYTVNGNVVTTGDGESYQICEQGSSFKYQGKSAGAEEGTWELTKR